MDTIKDVRALPVGSMVECSWPEGNLKNEIIVRCEAGSGAGVGKFSLMGGKDWDGINAWNAVITVLYVPQIGE